MYRVIFIYLGICTLINILSLFVHNFFIRELNNYGIPIGFGLAMGLYGNHFYFVHTKRKIEKIKNSFPNNPEIQAKEFQKQGGSSWKGVFISLAVFALFFSINYIIN